MEKDVFSALVRDAERTLYCVARTYLRCEADCEDALQSAILKAWEKRYTLRRQAYFKTWLTRILINECLTILRRQRRECPVEAMPPPQAPVDCDRLLWEDLRAIDEKYRIVLVLYYREGMTVEEIASVLRVPQGTVKNRLFRARAKMKNEWSEVTST